jgi:hypothetical protein
MCICLTPTLIFIAGIKITEMIYVNIELYIIVVAVRHYKWTSFMNKKEIIR